MKQLECGHPIQCQVPKNDALVCGWCEDIDYWRSRFWRLLSFVENGTCIRCGKEQATRGRLCSRCLVAAAADLMEEVPPPETPEEVDAELREFGLDPAAVGRRMQEAAQRALEEVGKR